MFGIYLKVTIEKKRRTQSFDFLRLKISSPGQFLGSFNTEVIEKCMLLFLF